MHLGPLNIFSLPPGKILGFAYGRDWRGIAGKKGWVLLPASCVLA